jgi:predicted N-formylglutamate amidohydrolase
MSQTTLLSDDDPSPVVILRPDASADIFLTCEHAGRQLPKKLGRLGLSDKDLERHIAWDIGAEALARALSQRFDASCVLQNFSRLVVDCNRWTHAEDFITTYSEDTPIPGNTDLHHDEVRARTNEIYRPYHETITAMLDARAAAGRETILVSVHTCTPVYLGVERPWHIGVLYQRDRRFAGLLLDELERDPTITAGDNEPYYMNDEKDYAVPVHGERRGLAHVEFEIRQDLVADEAGQREWAGRLYDLLSRGRVQLRGRHPEFFERG